VHRGRITKQGSKLVRWAAVEAVHHLPRSSALYQQLAAESETRDANTTESETADTESGDGHQGIGQCVSKVASSKGQADVEGSTHGVPGEGPSGHPDH